MGIFGSLIRDLTSAVSGKRNWTPFEIREMIHQGRLSEAMQAVGRLADETPERDLTALCLRGEITFRDHRDSDAEAYFRAALEREPGLADAHYGLSLVMFERGEKEAALRHAQFAVNGGKAARFSAQLGLCQLELGNRSLAESSLTRATRLDPDDKSSWNNLGIARRLGGDARGAQRAFERALEIDPQFQRAHANLDGLRQEIEASVQRPAATAPAAPLDTAPLPDALRAARELVAQGQLDNAIDALEVLCAREPDDHRYAIDLYRVYRTRGDTQSGLDVLRAFHARHPQHVELASALGRALVQENEHKQAMPLIEFALQERPDDVDDLLALADIRTEQLRYSDAGTLIERAVRLRPEVDVKGVLAANLLMRCEYERALAVVEEMLAERPSVAGDVSGIQIYALTQLGRHDEALPLVEQAIVESPNDPNRRFPRATINLLNERFGVGWDDYTYRNLSSTKHLRMLPFAEWKGEPLDGKAILVLADQGLGDQVMFASCLPDLLRLGPRRVVVEVNARVAKTIERSFPGCEVVPSKQDNAFTWLKELGAIDYFVTIGDLPRQFRRAREDFPDHDGFLQADPQRVVHWREQLGHLGSKPKIGVSWRGGTEQTRRVLRTMDVLALAPLMQACDADWVCLQYGDVGGDLERARAAGLTLHYWPEAIKDLDEFAALISALDQVVTVCNTTVHYAGALARPVWVMTPRVPEWRYGLRSTVLPWYPTSRLFRQTRDGDWSVPLEAVASQLASRYG